MRKIYLCILLFLILLPMLPVFADGMVMRPDPYSDRWDYIGENNQQAFINYKDGIERMVLSIELEKAADNAVWIFPVPSKPDEVDIDVITNLPKFRGEEISVKAKSILDMRVQDFLLSFQVYTLPYTFVKKLFMGATSAAGDGYGMALGGGGIKRETKPDVVVYKELKKEGMIIQVITAETSRGIYDYLKRKKLIIEKGTITALDYYIDKPFSFVVSWMNDSSDEKNNTKQKGVFVSFPAKNIYYPLVLTSVYGEKVIPTTIRILGHYNPQIPDTLKQYSNTEYYVQEKHFYTKLDYTFRDDKSVPTWGGFEAGMLGNINSWKESDITKRFYGINDDNQGPYGEIKYTKIEINAPSDKFTEDLWVKTGKALPVKASLALYTIYYFNGLRIFLLILLSMLAGPLAGWLVLRKSWERNYFYGFLIIGLSNCFTLVSLIILSFFVHKLKPSKLQTAENENADKKPRQIKKVLIRLLSLFFMIVGILFIVFLVFGFFVSMLMHSGKLNLIIYVLLSFLVLTFIMVKTKRLKFISAYSGIFVVLTMLSIKLLHAIL